MSLGVRERLGTIGRRAPRWRGWNRYRISGGWGLEGNRGMGLEGESSSNYLSWVDNGGEDMVYDMRVIVLLYSCTGTGTSNVFLEWEFFSLLSGSN